MDYFSLTLEARVQWALATYACDPQVFGDYTDYGAKMELAEELAQKVGWTYPNAQIPHLFLDVPYLRDIFERAAEFMRGEMAEFEADREAEQQRSECEAERQRECQRVSALIKANAWAELDLPSPEGLTGTLLVGDGATVNGHFVVYDSDDDMTWYTNPYGIDGVLSSGRPTVADVRRFLADMAHGVEYGPSPD